jgi:histidinol phosphatase-like enzyme
MDQDLIQLDIPFMVFAATSKEDIFRKPRIGMWNAYAKEIGVTSTDSTLL